MINLGKNNDLQKIPEHVYHALDLNSYSTLKCFVNSYKKYYKKYILKETINEKDSQYAEDQRFGSLVDCLKFQPETFDDQYTISTAPIPTGQMLQFVQELHKLCVKNTNEYGILCSSLDNLLEEAYFLVGFKRDKLDTVKEKFVKEGMAYFQELKDRGDKLVISLEELEWANSLCDYISLHPFTRDLFQLRTDEDNEIIYQYKVIGEILDLPMKGMIDMMHIDKKNKIIHLYDLKIMSNNTLFSYNYLKLMYYIQNAVYTWLVKQQYPDYQVNPIVFIAIDRYKNYAPTLVETSMIDYENAVFGFTTIFGRSYTGLRTIIDELKWHIDNNIWDCSRLIYENNGRIPLETNNYTEIE